ncbi:MAG: L-histidine N(alpha)-methyltransferase, partial [Anaerolineae bacterium]|nr:L-histidine N(alpha)-methyltransferase [Anaerolineae bacterium]
LNMLAHLNRELGADFNLNQFRHHAFYNEEAGRIEMHLVSLARQTVHLIGHAIPFETGETIWTESSYKYTPTELAALAGRAGLAVEKVWTDPNRLFSVQYLTSRNA